jgi:hypothetical protein
LALASHALAWESENNNSRGRLEQIKGVPP